jgi:hypothetical protein
MEFDVTPEWASNAILECAKAVLEGEVILGEVLIFEHGNGEWKEVSTSKYFNCGCNQFGYTPTFGDVGRLSSGHMRGLEGWFIARYPTYSPKVLKVLQKRNFVFTYSGRAFNFHMVESM